MVAPGTVIRQAMDNIVRARTGALLVFADERQVKPMISGGIDIDVELQPMILYELAKILGHANIKMTERYAKLAKDHIARTGTTACELWKLMEEGDGERSTGTV